MLEKIVAHKKQEIEFRKRVHPLPEVKRKAQGRPPARDFIAALKRYGERSTRIIAEIKKASPSRGVIRKDFNPEKIASIYQGEGASAISVLTDRKFFQGDHCHLALVRQGSELPVLCKDFIIDPYQIYEAAICGADAFLLIARLLSAERIEEFLLLGRDLEMKALVEVHGEDDIQKVLQTSAMIIGINNRDLKTFTTDVRTTLSLIRYIPGDIIVVSESGIQTRAHVERLEDAGVHAFLIGEALMREDDPGKKLQELRGR
ncbi:MAG: indole-3-glycerol phosphate synthase TrpC [Deltaproteobacteria bacterium]|nr:indole-3-glycerol phosphate synthase TrpC [Deltaproteobacteria bacterium]